MDPGFDFSAALCSKQQTCDFENKAPASSFKSLADFWFNIVVLARMGPTIFSLCALRFSYKIV